MTKQVTHDVMQAAAALAEAIEAENDALRALDVPRALAVTPRKAERARLLALALPALDARRPDPRAQAMAQRLGVLAAENKTLLERALTVQSRVIATLARAVPQPRTGYRPAGKGRDHVGAVALSSRA